MITIGVRKFGDLIDSSSEKIEAQDYIFRMIAKRGRVVSKKREQVYCEIIDLCYDENQESRIFKMSLVDASILDQRPEFNSKKPAEGLLGTWKLLSNGNLKFIDYYDGLLSSEAICEYLLSDVSHSYIRARYEKAFGSAVKA
jgi:hypothetical protein